MKDLPASESQIIPIATLIDELKNDNMAVRLASVRKLGDIARALGPERTRNELIPYLNEFIEDEDDVLVALAEQVPKLVDYVRRNKPTVADNS